MNNTKKLSHILIFVNKSIDKADICAFCTNVNKTAPQIRFTYQSYVNYISDDFDKLFRKTCVFEEDLFVITDSQEIIDISKSRNIACSGLYTDSNRKQGLSGVLYCIEDLEYITYDRILKMWQRFHNIPWTIVTTNRLVIREQTTEDIDALYEIYEDPEISRYTENLYSDKDEEYSYLVDYINNQYKYHEYGIWALVKKDTNELIGRAGLSLRPGCDDLELGFVIGKKYQRNGYCYEACKAIIEYAYSELYADTIVSYTNEKNTPSVNLLKKLGFRGRKIGEMCRFSLTKQ